MDRTGAQARVEQIEQFRRELGELERAGVLSLTAEQQAAVSGYHERTISELSAVFDVDRTEAEQQLSLGMRIASALGGLALCIAFGLFVQRYWGLLATWQQVILLIAAPLAALGLAEWASRKERTLYVTSLLSLVALAAFVVNLVNIGEIFSLTASPAAPTAWAAFALLLAARYELRLHLAIGLAGLIAVVPMWLFYFGGFAWSNPFERAELIGAAGVAVFLLARRKASFFAAVYRAVGASTLLAAILQLSASGRASFLPLSEKAVEGIYTLLCFAVSGGLVWLGVKCSWLETMVLGSVAFGVYLVAKMYHWLWDAIPAFVFFALLGIIGLFLIFVFRRLRTAMRAAV